MKVLIYILCSLVALLFAIKLFFALRGGKALLRLLLHAVLGIAALAAINLSGILIGVHIPVNFWSVGASAAFGIPAVCGQLLLQMLI